MCRRHHLPIHELLHYFLCPNTLSYSSCISWHNHTSSKFWLRTCLVFSAYIAGIHIFLWMEVIFHRCRQLNRTNTIYTNQWTCPQKKDTIVVFYSTLSPQKCTKLNTEKQNVHGHLGSNLTPERENRNFKKTVITNSTKPLCQPRGHLSWQSHKLWCHCKIHKKVIEKKWRLGSNLTPGGRLRVNK